LTDAWNEAFSDYPVPIEMTVDRFAERFARDGLSPSLSVVARVNGEIAGFVLNGVKDLEGRRVAWNGGTGISPRYRGRGIAHRMMEEAMEIYRQNGVEVATLEVLVDNQPAISLYEKWGYLKEKRLWTLSREGGIDSDCFSVKDDSVYRAVRGSAREVAGLPFYNRDVAWSMRYQNLFRGESVRILDENGETAGYALFQLWEREGEPKRVDLCQCETAPGRTDGEEIVRLALRSVFEPLDQPWHRRVPDFTTDNGWVISALKQAGFAVTAERYLMNRYF
jgi:GNAT superfamily N-acetyltransferase